MTRHRRRRRPTAPRAPDSSTATPAATARHAGQRATEAQTAPQTARAPSIRLRLALLGAFVVVFSTLQIGSYEQRSAVWDEPVHLTSGYLALAKGDYRLEATHPPFMRMWAALPLLFMPDVQVDTTPIDRTAPIDWHSRSRPYDFATRFLYVDNDADRLLYASRFMIVVCGLVLGILVWCWTFEWLGATAAAWALVFYTLSPNLLAHTSLVTTDAGITCFMFGTVHFLWRTSRRVTSGNLTGLALFFSLGIVTKYSAVVFGPVVIALLVVASVRRSAIRWRTAVGIVALLMAASFVMVWAVHGFRYAPSPTPSWELHLEQQPLARTVSGWAHLTAWIDHHRLLPNIFTEGFLMFAQSLTPPNWTFLAGAYSAEGWWYYFPLAFLMKTPIAFLALIAIGVVVSVRQWRQLGAMNEAFIAVPVAIYLALALTSTYQVGLRHILPLYPFLLLAAAAAAMELTRRTAGRMTLAALTCFWIAMLANAYPHTLTFFNQFVGGPSQGYRYLADSNVDWGQGLKQLKQWMEDEGVSHINLAYFGTGDPAYYGIDYTTLPAATPRFELPSIHRPWNRPRLPGYVAVSATVLTGVYLDPEWKVFYGGLRDSMPVAVVGNSIFVYRLDRWPEENTRSRPSNRELDADLRLGRELLKAEWYDHAEVHYRHYLTQRPGDPDALTGLGLALASANVLDEAISTLRHAVARAPDSGAAHLALAGALFDAREDLREIITHARRAVALLPLNAEPLVVLGRALAVSGALQDALGCAKRALAIDPASVDARELETAINAAAARAGVNPL